LEEIAERGGERKGGWGEIVANGNRLRKFAEAVTGERWG